MEKSNIEIVKEVLSKYKPRKRSYEEKENVWQKCYDKLKEKYKYEDRVNPHISWPPDKDFFAPMCFNKNKYSSAGSHFHVVNDKCDISDVCFCIDCNTLEISEHEIGKCPHSEYRTY